MPIISNNENTARDHYKFNIIPDHSNKMNQSYRWQTILISWMLDGFSHLKALATISKNQN